MDKRDSTYNYSSPHNKRRGHEIVPSTQPATRSAFALRERLLTGQPISSPAITTTAVETQSTHIQTQETASPRRPKRTRLAYAPSNRQDSRDGPEEAPSALLHTAELGKRVPIEPPPALPKESATPLSNKETPIEPPPILFSNFNLSRSDHLNKKKDGRVHLKLINGERLVILGSYGIHVTCGKLTVNGATLWKSKKIHWVDAPYCHALPVIRCHEMCHFDLRAHPGASTLRDLGRLSPHFRRLWNDTSELSDSTFKILYTSEDGPKRALLQELVSPAEWNKEMERLVNDSVSSPISVMVTGPKSSGKSTFGKLLANRLITHPSRNTKTKRLPDVAILDLDPGQPEYGVPSQISLIRFTEPVLQPSFCHPSSGIGGFEVIRSHSLASISPASDPDLYIEAARDLVTHYRNVLGTSSLIINTPGWIQGTGLDLLTSLISDLRPTEVVYMSQTGPAEAVESLQEACRTTTFSTLPSQAAQYTSRTAAQLRAMQTMSYFHAEADVDNQLMKWNTEPLTTVPPWVVSYAGENRGIFGITLYDYQASPELLADAINGTVLAAVEVESPLAFRDLVNRQAGSRTENDDNNDVDATRMDIDDDNSDNDNNSQKPVTALSLDELQKQITTATPAEELPLINGSATTTHGTTLDPRYSRFLGLVLVRGIDVRAKALQLLTPIPAATIEGVGARGGAIVLVSGKLDPASWAYTEDLYYSRHNGDRGGDGGGNGNDENGAGEGEEDELMDGVDDGTDAESSEVEGEDRYGDRESDTGPTPWIEVLHGNQKRGVGSKVWRVRRDLGRTGNAAG